MLRKPVKVGLNCNKSFVAALLLARCQQPIKRSHRTLYHILRPWSTSISRKSASPSSSSSAWQAFIEKPVSEPLHFKNVVLFNKRTRYELEKEMANRSEEEFQNYIRFLGSDYNRLLRRHLEHYQQLDVIIAYLKERGVNVTVVNRAELDDLDSMKSVDAVLTAGGDGTFLQAAGWVKNSLVPVVGFNTDPNRSQGHLCAPDMDVEDIFSRITSGRYQWLNRQRITVSISAVDNVQVTDLHAPQRPSWSASLASLPPDPDFPGFVRLPALALNEVFIGENNSAIAAYYEVCLDNESSFKQKSSGLTVSTGTGSTSWFYTIMALHPDTVKSLLQLANDMYHHSFQASQPSSTPKQQGGLPVNDPEFISSVVQAYNSGLLFHPEERRMAYAARDPIVNEVFKLTAPRGFCSKVRIKSRMQDGSLVMDGGIKYTFSMGAEAILRIAPQSQALRTISFFEPIKKPLPTTLYASYAVKRDSGDRYRRLKDDKNK